MKPNHSNRIVIFTDLDDTLIQTTHKIPKNASTTLGATDRSGQPLSFFTQSQRLLLNMFDRMNATIVPVTGRNTDALNRVQYEFNSYRVVSHGAVVLENKETLCQNWLAELDPQLLDWEYRLVSCNKEINQIIKKQGLDARSRVIFDKNIPAYISVKGSTEALKIIKQNNLCGADFNRHENGRNHALLPPYASKKKAVEFIQKQWNLNVNDLQIGLGDSLSDIEFMQSCQFSMIPVNSQITKQLMNV